MLAPEFKEITEDTKISKQDLDQDFTIYYNETLEGT